MMKPELTYIITTMLMIMIINMLTSKTSIMVMNLIMYTSMLATTVSMKMKLSPIPYIVFLTMIGGMMIIFLYLAATLWMKKETLTMKAKTLLVFSMIMPMMNPMKKFNFPLHLNPMNLLKNNFSKMTIILIILLTLLLMFTIEIHTKMNSPFRRKLKIWWGKKNF